MFEVFTIFLHIRNFVISGIFKSAEKDIKNVQKIKN